MFRWWKRQRLLQQINDCELCLDSTINDYYKMAPSTRRNDPRARFRLKQMSEYRCKLIELQAAYRALQ
jgi:hypothetical protein